MGPGFIFDAGIWIGEGKITFNTSPEFIKFYTRWEISKIDNGIIKATQTVEMQGIEEHVVNYFTFIDITSVGFSLVLESESMGKVLGTGVINPKVLAWELRENYPLDGFEVYELQENGDYALHAEYSSPDRFRTIIDGLIWKKGS